MTRKSAKLIKLVIYVIVIVVVLLKIYQNFFTVTLNTSNKNQQETAALPLKGKTIVLDPGHGEIDDGATSLVGTLEKTLTLTTAKVVKQKLKKAGANVILTRNGDTYVSLQQRAKLSNQKQADAFISLHYNWSENPSVNGVTGYYYEESKGGPLATDILNEVAKTTGLKNDGTILDNYSVLVHNSQPSTLIELGYLSNKQEDSVVESSAYRDQVAQGIYQGLLVYFSSENNLP